MADIIVSEFMDEAALEAARSHYDVLYDPTLVDDPDRLISLLGDARALIVRNRTQVRGDLLAAGARLDVIGRLGVGLDNIDVPACEARGIKVCPASGANDLSVAEYVITSALVLLRGAYFAKAPMRDGSWPRGQMMGREMSGKTMGLIGYGAIARETATRAAAMGMRVVGFDPYLDTGDPHWGDTRSLALDDLITTADVISLHVPLTDGTRNLLSSDQFAAMKPGAIVINAARGGVVHTEALIDAYIKGQIAGFALDVFEAEPLTAETGQHFPEAGNFILTPHIAGVTEESNIRVSDVTVQNVLAVLDA